MQSQHFKRAEFACHCGCGYDTIDAETLAVLEDVRDHFNAPVIINSACRCPSHNADIGGASHSQHLYGRACDIRVDGVEPGTVQNYLESTYPNCYGIGRYSSFTHVDTRTNGPARWHG